MTAEKKEVVEVGSSYAVMNMNFDDIKEVISVNLGEDGINSFDLDRIKVPAGGGTTWEIPTLEGTEECKEVKGVVIYFKDQRGFWPGKYDGSSNPPECRSDDNKHGIGDPGGLCFECPFSQFGSAEEGEGQACKRMKLLFILLEDNLLPIVVVAPPMSLRPMKKYFLRLSSKAVPYYGAITTLKLEKDKNAGGITYSKIKPEFVKILEDESKKKIKEFVEMIKPHLDAVEVDRSDYDGEKDTPTIEINTE